MKTLTLMCKMTVCDEVLNLPRSVITKPDVTWVYSQLSIDGGASPRHYWRGAYALMEDFWTKRNLDEYARWHGVSVITSLELEDEEADALIAQVHRNAIVRSPQERIDS